MPFRSLDDIQRDSDDFCRLHAENNTLTARLAAAEALIERLQHRADDSLAAARWLLREVPECVQVEALCRWPHLGEKKW